MKTYKELKQGTETSAMDGPKSKHCVCTALSWLHRAEQCEDEDGRFIFLWIAFNAAYAQDLAELGHGREQEKSRAFIDKLIELDEEETSTTYCGTSSPPPFAYFLIIPTYSPLSGSTSKEIKPTKNGRTAFEMAKTSANHALGARDAGKVLGLVLSRLYTLRNQLVHGGATWGSDVNRDQLRDSTRFLGKLVPKIIELMMDNPNTLWGDPSFPVVTAL